MNLLEKIKDTPSESIAYIQDSISYSYGNLYSLILKCSSYIRLKRYSKVIIAADDSVSLVVLFLGCINAGASPLLISPKQPEAVFKKIKERFKPSAIFNNDFNCSHVDSFDEDLLSSFDLTNFFLCTSGTTNQMKIVTHSSQSLFYTGSQFSESINVVENSDIFFSAAKMTHAFGLGNSLSIPLTNGACTILLKHDPAAQIVEKIIHRYNPSILCGVPRHLISFLKINLPNNYTPRLILSAGEHLPSQIREKIVSKFKCDIIDAIGSTEMLGFFLVSSKNASLKFTDTSIKYRLEHIEDSIFQLEVKSTHSSVGYFEEEKFKQGWIYTGDIFALSSFNSDVTLKYQGRAGDRIKINGHHAYLNEIDSEILKIEGVEDCYCTVTETEEFKKKLLIRIVTEASMDSIVSNMRKIEVLNRMPFMLEKVGHIPRTISGKVQRYI